MRKPQESTNTRTGTSLKPQTMWNETCVVCAMVLIGTLLPALVRAQNQFVPPGRTMVRPEKPMTPDDFRKYLQESAKEEINAEAQMSSARALLDGGGLMTLGMEAGSALDTEVDELARGLRYDPGLMYRFVHDHIEFYPMWGEVKDAAMTLMDRSGDAFDQASLLIALLTKAAEAPGAPHTITDIRYVVGNIELNAGQVTNWLGIPNSNAVVSDLLAAGGIPRQSAGNLDGTIDYVQMNHVWVKATIDGQVYEFDPSFKSHTIEAGLTDNQLASAMGYVQSTFLTSAQQGSSSDTDWVKDLNKTNIVNALTTCSTNLIDYIEANHPAGDLADLIGGKTIVPAQDSVLPPPLPYVKLSTIAQYPMGGLLSSYRTRVRIRYCNIDVWCYSSAIYGRRLILTFKPHPTDERYVLPYLWLDETLLDVGTGTRPGTANDLKFNVDHVYSHGDQYIACKVKAGGMWHIVNGWGHVGTRIIELHRKVLQQNRYDGFADDSNDVLGESFTLSGLTWVAEDCGTQSLVGQISECTLINHHQLGVMGQYQAPYIDMPGGQVSIVSHTDSSEAETATFLAIGGQSSAYEHGVIHQLQDYGAVSTAKLMDIANDRSTYDKIFAVTAANWDGIKTTQLAGYSAGEIAEVDSLVTADYTIYLPQYGDLQEQDWKGVGYLATKFAVDSMSATYGISGGYSGGYLTDQNGSWSGVNTQKYAFSDIGRELTWHPTSVDPIDLVTGACTYDHADIAIGNGGFPFGLQLDRQYNSIQRLEDGPLGLGWTHGFDITTKVTSDSFQAMGKDSPVDAAANVVGLYVTFDLFRDLSTSALSKTVVASIAEKWLMDQMIDNVVVVKQGHEAMEFIELPDGSFNPPPGKALRLIKEVDDTYLLKDNAGNLLDFDSDNRAVQWSDPHGNVVDFAYANDKLSSVTSKIGGSVASRSLTFTYDVDHVDTVTDSAGRTISFDYDADGNLTSYTDPEEYVTTFEYDATNDGQLWQVFYPDRPTEPYATQVYDSLDRVMQQTNASGQVYDYFYSYYRTEELEPEQTPPGGSATRYSKLYYFDDDGRTVAVEDQLGRKTTTQYDGHQRPTVVTSPTGTSVEYAYDGNHNVTQITRVPTEGAAEPDIIESFVYDSYENTAGRWFTNLQQQTDAASNVTTYEYDYDDIGTYGTEVGNLREVSYPEIDSVTPTTEFTYNAYGQVETQTDAEDVVTKYEYFGAAAGAGLKKAIVDYGVSGQLNLTTELTYDTVGNVLTSTDPRGNVTQSEYDDRRLPTKTISAAPFNEETTYEYYADGKLMRATSLPRADDAPCQATDNIGGYHGAIAGTRYISEGVVGLALASDGGGGHMIVPDDDALTPSDALSISFWVNWRGGRRTGIYKYTPAGSSAAYYIQVCDDGTVEGAVFAGTSIRDTLSTAGSISSNAWHHIVLTFDEGDAVIYVDGSSSATKTLTSTSIINDTQPLTIGGYFSRGRGATFVDRLDGSIDEVCVFDRSLTTNEVQLLRANGQSGASAITGFAEEDYPVAYWNLDDEPMTSTTFYTYTPIGERETVSGPFDDMTAHDVMANSDGAVKADAFWSTGIIGTALGSDGGDGHITIPDANCLTPDSTMTLSFWVNWGGSQRTGIYKYARGASSRAYYLQVRSDGKVDGVVFSDTDTYDTLTSTGTVAANGWHHVALTFDAGAAVVYIDGQSSGSKTMAVSSVMNDTLPLTLGGYWSFIDSEFVPRLDGLLDEVCVFDQALSALEVDQLYDNGMNGDSALTGFAAGDYPVGYWNLDEAQANFTQYDYDALDRPTMMTDAEGNVTETLYYPDGQVWKVVDAEDHDTAINTYNDDGSLASVADAKGNSTAYDYDGHMRLWRTTYEDSTYEQLTYDDAGRLSQRRTRAAQTIGITYDELNRVETKTLPVPSKTITYEYDLTGRIVSVIDTVEGTFDNTYDDAGRLTEVEYPDSKTVSYEYDDAGNRTKLTYPGGAYYVTYTYDELNRLVDIEDSTGKTLARYGYDRLSRRQTLSYYNGTGTYYRQNAAGRLRCIDGKGDTDPYKYAYTYDNVGNRVSMLVNDSQLHGYSYDDIYQLTGVDYPAGFMAADTTFNYDDAGNRSSVVVGATTSYSTNDLNQYTSVGGTGYTYDDNGNLTNDGVCSYTYDAENRLLTVVGIASYSYGPGGRRLTKTANSQTTRYYYDGAEIIAEYVGASASCQYVYGPGIDEPVCMQTAFSSGVPATYYYYHFDGLGNVVAVSDTTGDTEESYVYTVYGQVQATGTNIGNPYRFTGRRLDTESGLYYCRARYYNPAIGRFLQTDPIGYGDGINWYSYCGNNPIVLVDPMGLCRSNSQMNILDRAGSYLGAFGQGVSDGLDRFNNAVTGGLYDYMGWTNISGAAYDQRYNGSAGQVGQYANYVSAGAFWAAGGAGLAAGRTAVTAGGLLSAGATATGVASNPQAQQTARSALANARSLGNAGEAAVRAAYEIGPKTVMRLGTKRLVPDGLTSQTLSEVKNVAYQSWTQQLANYSTLAQQNKLMFDLYIRSTTTVSASVQAAQDSGLVNVIRVSGMGQ